MRNNKVVIDTTHGLILFPHLTMLIKTASSETTTKLQHVLTDDALTIPPKTTKTITTFVDLPSEGNTTGTVTPIEKLTERASLLISYSMSTIKDNRIAVRVTNVTESLCQIKRNTQIGEFFVITPERSKHIKRLDMAILSMIPKNDPDISAHLNELLRMNKLQQQNNDFWSPTPETSGKSKYHTSIQTRILKQTIELKENEKRHSIHQKTQSTR